MNPLHRAVAGAFKLIKKDAISFDHGTSLHYYEETIDSIFLLNSTKHVCFNNKSVKNLKSHIYKSLFKNFLKNVDLVTNNYNFYNKLFLNKKGQTKIVKKKKQNYFGYGFSNGFFGLSWFRGIYFFQ